MALRTGRLGRGPARARVTAVLRDGRERVRGRPRNMKPTSMTPSENREFFIRSIPFGRSSGVSSDAAGDKLLGKVRAIARRATCSIQRIALHPTKGPGRISWAGRDDIPRHITPTKLGGGRFFRKYAACGVTLRFTPSLAPQAAWLAERSSKRFQRRNQGRGRKRFSRPNLPELRLRCCDPLVERKRFGRRGSAFGWRRILGRRRTGSIV